MYIELSQKYRQPKTSKIRLSVGCLSRLCVNCVDCVKTLRRLCVNVLLLSDSVFFVCVFWETLSAFLQQNRLITLKGQRYFYKGS